MIYRDEIYAYVKEKFDTEPDYPNYLVRNNPKDFPNPLGACKVTTDKELYKVFPVYLYLIPSEFRLCKVEVTSFKVIDPNLPSCLLQRKTCQVLKI